MRAQSPGGGCECLHGGCPRPRPAGATTPSQLLLCHQLHNIWSETNTEIPFAVLTVGYVMRIDE